MGLQRIAMPAHLIRKAREEVVVFDLEMGRNAGCSTFRPWMGGVYLSGSLHMAVDGRLSAALAWAPGVLHLHAPVGAMAAGLSG